MIFGNFKDFIVKSLILPKTLLVGYPGVVVNKTVSRFGRVTSRTRTAYFFEDVVSSLYWDSLRKLGREKTDELWYRIGKESSLRYLSFMGSRDFSGDVLKLVLEYCLNSIRSTGFSFVGDFTYDAERKFLEICGRDNIVCRNTGSGSLVAGVVAGIMTYFQGENFEAESFCERCPNCCRIISHLGVDRRCVVDVKDVAPCGNYDDWNFSGLRSLRKSNSFGDFIKFNKVNFDNKRSKFFFQDRVILTSEIGLGELFLKNYSDAGYLDLFEESVVSSSSSVVKGLTAGMDYKERLKFISSLVSGFGWGVPRFRKDGDVVVLDISNPIRTRFGVSHVRYVICGFLNEVYGKRFEIKEFSDSRVAYRVCSR